MIWVRFAKRMTVLQSVMRAENFVKKFLFCSLACGDLRCNFVGGDIFSGGEKISADVNGAVQKNKINFLY